MKMSFADRKALEQNEILKRAADAGVQARKRGNSHVELDNDQFARLVDQRERFAELLKRIINSLEDAHPARATIPEAMVDEIQNALAGR